MKSLSVAVFAALAISWCQPKPPEPPPDQPPYNEACQALLDEGLPWCHDVGLECGDCVHNPTSDPKACERAPACPEPPPVTCPEECPAGTHCEGTSCVPDEVPPPSEPGCRIDGEPGPGIPHYSNELGSVVNKIMADLTGCSVGSRCVITVRPQEWQGAVEKRLSETSVGGSYLCAGQHTPDTDEIAVSVSKTAPREGFHIYAGPGWDDPSAKGTVVWSPGADRGAWEAPDTPTEPPPGPGPDPSCGVPDPSNQPGQFKLKHHNNVWDSTFQVTNRDYCAQVQPPFVPPRNACPVRQEGDPTRVPCERLPHVIGDQKWWCDGHSIEHTENPAQAACTGHVKTCTEDGRICAEADW